MPTPTGRSPVPAGVIIVDMGEHTLKAGYAGAAPTVFVPNRYTPPHGGAPIYPVQRGAVVDWDALAHVWANLFRVLETDPRRSKVFVVVPTLGSSDALRRLSELLFQRFSVPALCFGDASVLSACSAQMQTGILLDCGAGATTAAAILNGKTVDGCVATTPVGGRDVTACLARLLASSADAAAAASPASAQRLENPDFVDELKEAYAFANCRPGGVGGVGVGVAGGSAVPPLAHDFHGVTIADGEEHRCAEVLFHPRQLASAAAAASGVGTPAASPAGSSVRESSVGLGGGGELNGVHELVAHVGKKAAVLASCAPSRFFGGVYLAGGGCRLRGFAERLELEVQSLLEPGAAVHLYFCTPDDPRVSAWTGASNLALGSVLPWRSRGEYLEMRRVEAEAAEAAARRVQTAGQATAEMARLGADAADRATEWERRLRRDAEAEAGALRSRLAEEKRRRVREEATAFFLQRDPGCAHLVDAMLAQERYAADPEGMLAELRELYRSGGPLDKGGGGYVEPATLLPALALDSLRRREPRRTVRRVVALQSRTQGTGMFMKELGPVHEDLGPLGDCVVVAHVDRGGPADLAGVCVGDTVVGVCNEPVGTLREAVAACNRFYNDFGTHTKRTPGFSPQHGPDGQVTELELLVTTHDAVPELQKQEFRSRYAEAYAALGVAEVRKAANQNGTRAGMYAMAFNGSDPVINWPKNLPSTAAAEGGGGGGDGDKKEKKEKKGKKDKKDKDGGKEKKKEKDAGGDDAGDDKKKSKKKSKKKKKGDE